MMYLDANFFIFALLDQTKKGDNARTILKDILNGNKITITSCLAIDEVMWIIIKTGKKGLLRNTVEDIYNFQNLEVREVPSLTPIYALEFIEKYNLKPRDAFHAAIMKQFHVDSIVSDDSDFDRIKDIRRVKL